MPLSDRQQRVLMLRAGLYDGVALSLAQTGDRMDLTRERVRQVETNGLKALGLETDHDYADAAVRFAISTAIDGFADVSATLDPEGFGRRRRSARVRMRDLVRTVAGQKMSDRITSAGVQLIAQAATQREFIAFLDFYGAEAHRYGMMVSPAVVAMCWDAIEDRDGQCVLSADKFRSGRDAFAAQLGEYGRTIVQELIWSGAGSWQPPQHLVAAIAEFRALAADPARLRRYKRNRRARERVAAARQMQSI